MRADTDLGQALASYLQAVKTEIQNRDSTARRPDAKLAVMMSKNQILLGAVEYAEKRQEFQNLVRQTASLFCPEALANGSLSKLSQQTLNFFRVSGTYCDLLDRRPVQPRKQLARFKASLEAKDRTVTYYAPIEWVNFGKDLIRFGEFEIRRLTTAEMELIFSDRIRRIFYPWAQVNVAELAGYWFLVAKEAAKIDPPGKSVFRFRVEVDPHHPRFSTPIDRALSLLALGDWVEPSPPQDGKPRRTPSLDKNEWPLPELVPFVIGVSTNFLEWPHAAPDTSVLNRIDGVGGQTGETQPNFQVHWDAAKADEFEHLLVSALGALDAIRAYEQQWAFMGVALRFLSRAFTSQGIESLLWNITAVDALLGEDTGGIKKRLSGRIGRMLGEAQTSNFKALYEIRSDLVHGNPDFKHHVLVYHLGAAAKFARLAARWMLGYLAAVAAATQRLNCPVPDREDLLAILDGKPSALNRHRAVVDALPKSFPKVKAWLAIS